jgi:mono/diheme cytochrome c family protein
MRFLRLALRAVASIAAVVAILALTVFLLSNRVLHARYNGIGTPVTVAPTADLVATGRHLAEIRGCVACHGADAGGAVVMDNRAMGTIYGPNLTRGEGGVGAALSDADWERAIRHGVNPYGRGILIMPSRDYAMLSDADTAAIIAYMKSVPPVNRTVPPLSVGPVLRGLLAFGKAKLSASVIDHSRTTPLASVAADGTAKYGRYLATICTGCHNPNLSGGKIVDGSPNWPPASNLTKGPGSAVAGWTGDDFIRTIRTRKAPDGHALDPVMPTVFAQMSDMELKAVWAYIQTREPRATGQ